MIKDYTIAIDYKVGDTKYSCATTTEHLEIKDISTKKNTIKIELSPKCEIELLKAELKYKYKYPVGAKVLCNGYQSWSYTREYSKNEKLQGMKPAGKVVDKISFIAKYDNMVSLFGDYFFYKYPKSSGIFHSHTYSYIRDNDNYTFFGSLSERSGYTIINYNMNTDEMSFTKDVEGAIIDSPYMLYDMVEISGTYNSVFDEYFKVMKVPETKIKHMAGYTSWYNYFGKISEDILLRDLEGMDKVKDDTGIFQIDDGYQIKVGDWLTLKDDIFPNGMKYIADKIHAKGLLAGIWIAPFNAARSSQVVKDHPEWFIKNNAGKTELGTIAWGGAYTLDIYNPECREYIKNFFNVILNEWGYDLVKLDFLYSQCITPRNGKSRGQIMCEAMDFLRECVGDKLILGCGVPLGPAFGKVDLCRISSDVDLKFRHKFYYYFGNREIVNSKSAMTSSIYRRHLDGRVFCNDPDVFFLRNDNLRYNNTQKLLLAKINNMFGNVLFVSDNIGDYDANQLQAAKESFTDNNIKVISVTRTDKNEYEIIYIEKAAKYKWCIDMSSGKSELENIDNQI